jgi:hypothetical protein
MSISILSYIEESFPTQKAINRAELRAFLHISLSTDARMKKSGDYPLVTLVGNSEMILLVDFANWLDANRGRSFPTSQEKPRRGRPKGSKNKPKTPPLTYSPPALPAHMQAEITRI